MSPTLFKSTIYAVLWAGLLLLGANAFAGPPRWVPSDAVDSLFARSFHLGFGYDPVTQTPTGSQCTDGSPVFEGFRSKSGFDRPDSDSGQLLRAQLRGTGAFAQGLRSDFRSNDSIGANDAFWPPDSPLDLSLDYSFSFQGKARLERRDPPLVARGCERTLDTAVLGAVLMIRVQFRFLDQEARYRLTDAVRPEVRSLQGLFPALRQWRESEAVLDQTTIRIHEAQFGGALRGWQLDPNELECSLSDLSPCELRLRRLIGYLADPEAGMTRELIPLKPGPIERTQAEKFALYYLWSGEEPASELPEGMATLGAKNQELRSLQRLLTLLLREWTRLPAGTLGMKALSYWDVRARLNEIRVAQTALRLHALRCFDDPASCPKEREAFSAFENPAWGAMREQWESWVSLIGKEQLRFDVNRFRAKEINAWAARCGKITEEAASILNSLERYTVFSNQDFTELNADSPCQEDWRVLRDLPLS